MRLFILFTIISAVLLISCNSKSEAEIKFEKKVKELARNENLTEFEIINGIGPITNEITIPEQISPDQIIEAKAIFKRNCRFCHKVDTALYAPSLRYVTEYRTPEFILNLLLNPEEMTEKHPLARRMAELKNNKMRFKALTETQAMSILAYLRDLKRIGREEKIAVTDTALNLIDL